MLKVTWILSVLWNQMVILSVEEKTCEVSNWIVFTYYLFWEDFEANDEHARSWELLLNCCLPCVPVPFWADASGKLDKTFSKLFSVIQVPLCFTQLIFCAMRKELKTMQQCSGKWGPILLSPFFVLGPFFKIRWEYSFIVWKDYNVWMLRITSVCW